MDMDVGSGMGIGLVVCTSAGMETSMGAEMETDLETVPKVTTELAEE